MEEQARKAKKKKPRVIHALGNMKWGFAPPQSGKALNVDALQTKWDRDHSFKQKVCFHGKATHVIYYYHHYLLFFYSIKNEQARPGRAK